MVERSLSKLSRGQICLINLDPTVGSEVKKTIPCVVFSPPEMNQDLRAVIVVPITSKGTTAPFRISITFDAKKGLILVDQIRTIDKSRLVKKLGAVIPKTLESSLLALQETFTL